MITHLITSFIASYTFGIMFNVPRKSLIKCGFVGMVGWFVYILMVNQQYDPIISSIVAAFSIGVISQICARIYRAPNIIFSIPGIIPLVPGGIAYNAVRQFVENDYNLALELAAKATMTSGGIAIGLIVSEVLNQLLLGVKLKKNR